jgi:hypothetical protein
MKKKQGIQFAVAAAFVAAFGVSGLALAMNEVEPNVPIASAITKPLSFDSSGRIVIDGAVGELPPGSTTGRDTVDFFSFFLRKDVEIEANIDGGIKPAGTPRSVDTSLYILDPAFKVVLLNDTALVSDAGSMDSRDAHIPVFKAPKDGIYTVAVTGVPRRVIDGGGVLKGTGAETSGGTYTLTISLLAPPVQIIHIEVKPGSGESAPINPNARGSIPVALLGSPAFNVLAVEPSSLTFGRTGDEQSWQRCAKEGTDVNGDGHLDLVCHFDNRLAKFADDTFAAILKGSLKSAGTARSASGGGAFEGHADLKVRPK